MTEVSLKKKRNVKKVIASDEELFSSLPYTPSKYQKDIFSWVRHGQGNAVVSAVPGSGKTTTLITCVNLIDKSSTVLVCAFNKSIEQELKAKITRNKTTINTVHTFGLRLINSHIKGMDRNLNVDIDDNKYKKYIKANLPDLTDLDAKEDKLDKKQLKAYEENIITLVDKSRLNGCQTDDEIRDIAKHYRIDLFDDEVEVVQKVIKWGMGILTTIDFTDMLWLPYVLNIPYTFKSYDWVFVDEVQDLSRIAKEIILKGVGSNTRMLLVGDRNQSIYGFSGAWYGSFDYWTSMNNTIELPLSICYRCGKSIVNYANKIEDGIECKEDAIDGEVIELAHLSDVKENDLIICRRNFPLMKAYMRLLEQGKPCYIKGREIASGLIYGVKNINEEILYPDLERKGLLSEMYKDLFETINSLYIKRGRDLEDAIEDEAIIMKYDSIRMVETLCKGIRTKTELMKKLYDLNNQSIDDTNSTENFMKGGICLSTIHKAKGLEFDRVFVLCKSQLNAPNGEALDWEKIEEKNLEYVAVTRAKKTLAFITEQEISSDKNPNEKLLILQTLRAKQKTISRLYNLKDIDFKPSPKECVEIASEVIKPIKKEEVKKTNSVKLTSNEEKNENTLEQLFLDFDSVAKTKKKKAKRKVKAKREVY